MKENAIISLKTLQNVEGDEEVNEIELKEICMQFS